jgi:hypothetical protein
MFIFLFDSIQITIVVSKKHAVIAQVISYRAAVQAEFPIKIEISTFLYIRNPYRVRNPIDV